MFGLQFASFLCLVVLISCITPSAFADLAVPASDNAAPKLERAKPMLTSSDADVNAGTIMADNNIRISDSKIVLAAQDKQALLKAIADAVLAQQVGLTTASDDDAGGDDSKIKTTAMKNKAVRGALITVTFPVSRGAFLYYVPDPRDASQNIVRLGWRYALADWKLYRALIAPNACEVKRTIGDYYYC